MNQGHQLMEAEQIQALIENAIEGATAKVTVNGNSCQVSVISDSFEGLSRVKKQQLVYGCLNDDIASGALHAVTMQTFTQAEWEKAQKFQSL